MSFSLLLKDELIGFYKSKIMIFLWIGLPLLAIVIHLTTNYMEGMSISFFTALIVSNLGGFLASVMVTVNFINEKDQRVYDLFLIRPIKRWNILLSKFLAVYICVSIACIIAISIGMAIDYFQAQIMLNLLMEQIIDLLIVTLSTIAIATAFGVLIGIISPSIVAGVIIVIFIGQYIILIPSIPGLFEFSNKTLIVLVIGIIITVILMVFSIIAFNKKQFMKKVTITLSEETWKWWKKNPWINLSQLTERELKRIKALEERVLGTCPKCGSEKLRFNGKTYRCAKCGFEYS
jgi:ABC-type transport system involved in multi-copper enzyme maturation permease subunit